MKRNLLLLGLVAVLAASTVAPAFAQDRMTFEQYQAELTQWQQREDDAKTRIDELNAKNEGLVGEINELDGQISALWQEIYDMLGLTAEEIKMFADELDAVGEKLSAYDRMTPEEIYQNAEGLDEIEARLGELEKHLAALLSEYKDKIAAMYNNVASVRARMAKPPVINYTVMRGDYLWKIAAKKEHFGDGMKWMRIYSVNRDVVKNPDLIFPDQKLAIPMGLERNQYLVQRGDHLYGIAESLFNNPFKWRELYNNNKGLIKDDPNYIVPEMILEVPGR